MHTSLCQKLPSCERCLTQEIWCVNCAVLDDSSQGKQLQQGLMVSDMWGLKTSAVQRVPEAEKGTKGREHWGGDVTGWSSSSEAAGVWKLTIWYWKTLDLSVKQLTLNNTHWLNDSSTHWWNTPDPLPLGQPHAFVVDYFLTWTHVDTGITFQSCKIFLHWSACVHVYK